MEPTEAFTRLVRQPEAELALDEAALLIAAHDHDVDLAANLAVLDELARDAPDEVVDDRFAVRRETLVHPSES